MRVSQLSLSHCRHARSYSYHHYAHHHAHTRVLVWHGLICHASVGMCNVAQDHVNGTDTVGRSVGRSVGRLVGWSVDAHVPVDRASVGLTQGRPKYLIGQHLMHTNNICWTLSHFSGV